MITQLESTLKNRPPRRILRFPLDELQLYPSRVLVAEPRALSGRLLCGIRHLSEP